jgi:hypothetical protein
VNIQLDESAFCCERVKFFMLFILTCAASGCPLTTSVDGGPSEPDGGADCVTSGFRLIADLNPFEGGQQSYVGELFSAKDSTSTGSPQCFELSIRGPQGPVVGSVIGGGAMNENLGVAFTPTAVGQYCYQLRAHRVGDLMPRETHGECVTVRALPTLAPPCLVIPSQCTHTASALGYFACDEKLYTLDGGTVGVLADGGFFMGEGDLLLAYEMGMVSSVSVNASGLTRSIGVPSLRPSRWAVAPPFVAIADADAGTKFALDAGVLVLADTFSSAGFDVLSLFKSGTIAQASHQQICGTGCVSTGLNGGTGIISAGPEGLEFCWAQYAIRYPLRATELPDGGLDTVPGNYPLCGRDAQPFEHASFPRRRMLLPNRFGAELLTDSSSVFAAPNARWYTSETRVWAVNDAGTTMWCE